MVKISKLYIPENYWHLFNPKYSYILMLSDFIIELLFQYNLVLN